MMAIIRVLGRVMPLVDPNTCGAQVKNVLPGECTLQHTAGLDATTGGRQGDDSICGEAVDSQTKNLEGQAVSDSRWFARMDAKFSGTTVQDRSCGYKGLDCPRDWARARCIAAHVR
jgi:hypothetical protein